jgi:hypothetical protein
MKYLFAAYPHLGKISLDVAELFGGKRVFDGHTA